MQNLELSGSSSAPAGFAPRRRSDRAVMRRARLMVQAIAAIGLMVSLAVAATVVSIGIVRAQTTTQIAPTPVFVTTAQ